MWRSQVRWMTILLIKSFMLNKNMNLNWLQWHLSVYDLEWKLKSENVHNSHCLNMVEMALRCHHLAYRFKTNSGGDPRTPRRTPPLPKAAYGPVNKWYDGLREYHTPGGGVSALLKPTAPERYHQSYCVYVRGVCPRWKINCVKNCSLLYIL